jgi:hypothetical protein
MTIATNLPAKLSRVATADYVLGSEHYAFQKCAFDGLLEVPPQKAVEQAWSKAIETKTPLVRRREARIFDNDSLLTLALSATTCRIAAIILKAEFSAQVRNELIARQNRVKKSSSVVVEQSDFMPSFEVVHFWKAGIKAFLDSSFAMLDEDIRAEMLKISEITDEEFCKEFARRFRALISTLGFRHAHGLYETVIADSGRFTLPFQLLLLDRFQIVPDQAGDFFSKLHHELDAYLKRGGALEGNWGKLLSSEKGIGFVKIETVPNKRVVLWKKARVVE